MTATYIALATITLTSTDSEIVFSSIPATYRDLVVVATGNVSVSFNDVYMRFNGATSGYSNVQMSGSGSVTASGTFGTDVIRFNFYGGWDNSNPGTFIANIFDYAQTKHKTALGRVGDAGQGVDAGAGRWASTNAINQVSILSGGGVSFAVGSTFSLYGIN